MFYYLKTNSKMGLLHEKLTYKILGCFYDVHNDLGIGYDEESYHMALEERLKIAELLFQSKVEKYILHREIKIHKYILDLIVEDKVIVELKNISTNFHPMHHVQTFAYLKCWQKDLGLLVNFGTPSVNIKRIAFTEKTPLIKEDYNELNKSTFRQHQELLKSLRVAILNVLELHGLGYNDSIYKPLVQTELTYLGIPFIPKTSIPVKFQDKIVRSFELKTPIIANQIICNIIALKDDITIDIKKTRTYLKDTNVPIGLLIHFGKEKLEIIALSSS